MEDTVKTFSIPSEICRKSGIAAAWLPINRMGVFPYESKKFNSTDAASPFAPVSATVFNVRQQVILFEPILRKFVNEANTIFLNVQEQIAGSAADGKAEHHMLNFSRQYRSVIRDCLVSLQDEVVGAHGEYKEELQNYITIFYSVECVWHLCEILFVDTIPGNAVLPQLLEWVRFHFPKHELKAASLLAGDLIGLETRPEYWDTIIGSLLQGRIEVTRALLRLHPDVDKRPFKLADEVLKTMPVYSVFNGLSTTEFNLRRKHWVVDAQAKIDSKVFVTERRLDHIMRLVVGEEGAWNNTVLQKCEAWYEYLAAWLFFTEPTVKAFELGQYALRCINRIGIQHNMKHLDHVLLSVMKSELVQVVKEVQHMSENGWFVSHLVDLLYHSGRLDVLDTADGDDLVATRLRECFLLDYGTLLMGHTSLWQVGLSYLDHCPTDGLNTIELLLCRIPQGSEARTLKIIREAQKRDLVHVAQGICRVQGMLSLKRKRLGNALAWALKSQDGIFTSFLADKFLKKYVETGELLCVDLLENLGSCMLACDKTMFLGKYYEFHQVYQQKKYREAANIIVSLIASKLTPKYFWVTLLVDVLPLLECDELILSSNDTYTILHALEERQTTPGMEDKVSLIRLASSRNLARALVDEIQFPGQ